MPGSNENLHRAKNAKNDEFYTQLSDIETELNNYTDKFNGKVVYCNCDDPFESNFVKYFLMNFNRLGLKELIAAGYTTDPAGETGPKDTDHAYAIRVRSTKEYIVGAREDLDEDGVKRFLTAEKDNLAVRLTGNAARDESGNPVKVSVKEKYQCEDGKTKTRTIKRDLFYRAGDFRSDMSIELLKQADIVATNPPFSLFREYVAQLMEYWKKFVIIGNKNAIAYKEVFPLLKDNKIWLGYSIHSGDRKFNVPDDYPLEAAGCGVDNDGKKFMRVNCVRWFANIGHGLRHQPLLLDTMAHNLKFNKKLKKKFENDYGKLEYPHYDNYDAIEVPFVEAIPSDYDGMMGVPITFMDKYDPEQFEIIGVFNNSNIEEKQHECFVLSRDTKTIINGAEKLWNGPVINKMPLYIRIVIRPKKN